MPFGSGKLLPPSPVHLAASVRVKCRAMMSCSLSIGTLMAPASAGSYMNTLKNNLSSGERKQRQRLFYDLQAVRLIPTGSQREKSLRSGNGRRGFTKIISI